VFSILEYGIANRVPDPLVVLLLSTGNHGRHHCYRQQGFKNNRSHIFSPLVIKSKIKNKQTKRHTPVKSFDRALVSNRDKFELRVLNIVFSILEYGIANRVPDLLRNLFKY
jgi:hypothetical protein